MLTYDLQDKSVALYKNLYEKIRNDIKSGLLKPKEKLPSKRMLANNLGVSTITVEKAYDQLISEGYIYALPQKGYYVSEMPKLNAGNEMVRKEISINIEDTREIYKFDFSSNQIESSCFPFSIWARLTREVIATKEKELMTMPPYNGVKDLRQAIAGHLSGFRGMVVSPDQIVIGAGTEYLYGILVKLLGENKIYSIENPGYKKLRMIYEANHVDCRYIRMDEYGICIENLKKAGADVAHISPTHHFPTGITMPVSRRYELLAWANEKRGRYIIEDDYDSEFRINGNPIPTLQSIDVSEKVIYMNTFSKSLASTIRISYMVLPEHLARRYYEKLSFYSCTVPTFEQYTLAVFINQGYFEKHINRMRLYYGRKRNKVLDLIRKSFASDVCEIIENDSGLHFLIKLSTTKSDEEIIKGLKRKKIKIRSVNEFYMDKNCEDGHTFIINYSNMDVECLKDAMEVLVGII